MPHGWCFLWDPNILSLHVGSDALIAFAYYAIPLVLLIRAKHEGNVERRLLFYLYAAFIFMCGMTHVVGILTIWKPAYLFSGIVKFLTAAISLFTLMVMTNSSLRSWLVSERE